MTFKKPKPFTLLVVLHAVVLALAIHVITRRPSEKTFDTDTIVVMPIEGVITMGRGGLSRGGSVDELVAAIDDLAEKKDVKALVLKINSPGGSVGAVQAVYEALLRFRKAGKPIVSTFGDVAASGGYYIACAGDRIVSHPGTLTGSIGVVMQMPNVTGLMQKIGVSMNTITSGAMKDSGSPFRQMSAAEQAHFKALIEDAYAQFFDAVKAGRKAPEETLRPVADGRVMSGRMAMQAKLVDSLGGQKEAVELAKELAGLKDKKPRVIERKDKPSIERLMGFLSRSPIPGAEMLSETGPRVMYLAH